MDKRELKQRLIDIRNGGRITPLLHELNWEKKEVNEQFSCIHGEFDVIYEDLEELNEKFKDICAEFENVHNTLEVLGISVGMIEAKLGMVTKMEDL